MGKVLVQNTDSVVSVFLLVREKGGRSYFLFLAFLILLPCLILS